MEHLSAEISKAIDTGLYSVALYAALALPDNCATMDPETYVQGKAGETYRNWFDKNLKNGMPYLTANDLWRLRCRTLHNGQLETAEYDGIIFSLPDGKRNIADLNTYESDLIYLNIDLRTFCNTIIDAVDAWWDKNRGSQTLLLEHDRLVRYRPDGFPGFIGGIPVIA